MVKDAGRHIFEALIVAGQTERAKRRVGPALVGSIGVLSVHWSIVGGPAVTHSSSLSGQI